jgi:hypothetical protein
MRMLSVGYLPEDCSSLIDNGAGETTCHIALLFGFIQKSTIHTRFLAL